MASAEEAIFALLSNDSDVTDIVGTRIYPVITPEEGQYPALSYFRVDGPREHVLEGPAGLARPRIQVDAWANDSATARAAIAAVISALDGFIGNAGGVRVAGVIALGDHDLYEPRTKTFHVAADFLVMHEERNSG
jgi:hypothetical protein